MNRYAEEFIKSKIGQLELEKNDGFQTITVRLNPKHAVMLRLMSDYFNFSISTSFSEIISKHIFDMVINLDDKEFEEFKEKFKGHLIEPEDGVLRSPQGNNALGLLREKELIEKPGFLF